MAHSYSQAIWLLILVTPLCLWVAWSDMATMKITNKLVYITFAAFVVAGAIVLPFDAYMWRFLNIVLVLAVGFGLNAAGLVGGGDAKFAAAAAGFIAPADSGTLLMIFAVTLVGAYATHRIFSKLSFVRSVTPNWQSWQEKKDFPMGLALGGTLIIYFVVTIYLS